MPQHDKLLIHYAEGRGFNLGRAENKVGGWGVFCKALSTPTRTKERRAVFDKMTTDQQNDLKAVDGWLIGAQITAGSRKKENIQPRDLLSLDYDYPRKSFPDEIEMGLTPLSRFEFFCHSSRRYTKSKPRIRLFAPLSRPVTRDEYVALSRLIALKMEGGKQPMTMVDKVSFRQAQMMFKPTASADGEFWSHRNEGEIIDPDAIFAEFPDWQDYSKLPLCEGEADLRKSAAKAEDPTTKKGPVGDFCRAYDIFTAIETFLPDIYRRSGNETGKPRYTYIPGSATDGAEVEDGDKFLYSHHGTDPVADRLVNAFDLVRVHLYGHLDEDEPKDTPPTKLPSYKAMIALINDDPEYRRSQAASRYDIAAMFEDVDDDDPDDGEQGGNEGVSDLSPTPEQDENDDPIGTPHHGLNGHAHDVEELIGFPATSNRGAGSPVDRSPRIRTKPAPKDWFPDALQLDLKGNVLSTMPNAAVIIHNDARLFGAIAFNDFSKQIVALRSIKSKLDVAPAYLCRDRINGDRWQDVNDVTIRMILEAPNGPGKVGYGMQMADRNVAGAIVSAAHRNKFHPVRDYLEARAWDGEARMGTLLIRYLGCPDSPYYREIIRWMMIASVARIMEPGCKFDYAIILQGETGIRKSSFVKALYSGEWFAELDCRLDDKQQIAETISGAWCLELPELSGFHKSDHNAAKAFMRRQYDDVRMAYDRRVSEFPRQCVFWGTTNDLKYLKDPTGNRSYWPVPVETQMIDTDGVAGERDQLWAEAVAAYRAMRARQKHGDLPLTLHSREAIDEATALQESARSQELHEMWRDTIQEWADKPLTLRELMIEYGLAPDERFSDGTTTADIMVVRVAFTREMAARYALGKDRGIADYQTAQTIERALPLLDGWHQPRDRTKHSRGGARLRVLGKQARWCVRSDANETTLKNGYRIVQAPSGGNDSGDEDLI